MGRLRLAWYWIVGRTGDSRFVRWAHPIVYSRFGGAGILGRSLGNLTVILVATGRHSGRVREVPLWAYADRGRLVLVGTNGGRKPVPGWVYNLRANPEAQVHLGRDIRAVRAAEAEGDEWERLWALVTAAYPGYLAYLRWIHRPVPLVILAATDGRPLVEEPGLVGAGRNLSGGLDPTNE